MTERTGDMKSTTWQDDHPWTHIDWELNDVTPYQLDWFWRNMEKGDYLWHPNQHKGFEWWISLEQAGGPLGSVHVAPQTWNDGVKIRPYIKMVRLEDVPDEMRDLIKYDHVVIAGAISILGDNVKADDPVLGYRIHQWQKSDGGCVGMSSGMEAKENAADDGLIWAAHATEEVGNWEVFLPDLVRLYRVIPTPRSRPTTRSVWTGWAGTRGTPSSDEAPGADSGPVCAGIPENVPGFIGEQSWRACPTTCSSF